MVLTSVRLYSWLGESSIVSYNQFEEGVAILSPPDQSLDLCQYVMYFHLSIGQLSLNIM